MHQFLMPYIYGPIPSRRLGQSLGVDPIPLKTCNWNCVYCQLGRTTPLTNARREYVPRYALMEELAHALARHPAGDIDHVSFVGSGEPTLHVGLGWMLRRTKALTSIPVAVITNGSLLYRPDVRAELTVADVVMPTLVAGTAALYRRINRPHPELTFARQVDGLVHFRREYAGKLWIEVMLIRDLNDDAAALTALAGVLQRIRPDAVHITLPDRPPSETWVAPPDAEGLMRATAILGDIAEVVHPAADSFDLSGYASVVEAVINIITRHPMSQEQLLRALQRWSPGQIDAALRELAAGGRARMVTRHGTPFWTAAESHFPAEAQSLRTSPAALAAHHDPHAG